MTMLPQSYSSINILKTNNALLKNAMKIYKIQVENFRLLKNFSIDVEDELSLVLGKNNTGKTSILSVLDKFLNHSDRNKFYYDDFNIDYKEELYSIINGPEVELQNYSEKGIKLKLFISYTSACNLENVSRVMMDLDPDNNLIVLGFEYVLPYEIDVTCKRRAVYNKRHYAPCGSSKLVYHPCYNKTQHKADGTYNRRLYHSVFK